MPVYTYENYKDDISGVHQDFRNDVEKLKRQRKQKLEILQNKFRNSNKQNVAKKVRSLKGAL